MSQATDVWQYTVMEKTVTVQKNLVSKTHSDVPEKMLWRFQYSYSIFPIWHDFFKKKNLILIFFKSQPFPNCM